MKEKYNEDRLDGTIQYKQRQTPKSSRFLSLRMIGWEEWDRSCGYN